MLDRFDMPHLAARVFGTPLVIARSKLDAILHVLGPRLGLASPPSAPSEFEPKDRSSLNVTKDGIARIQVIGTLVGRSGGMDAASGMTSYLEVANEVDQALGDAAVRAILLEIDSPGGEAVGVFDVVDSLVQKIGSSSKPCYAVANELACSGAYLLACVADRIYVPRTGSVGSIGVVALHVDQSSADKADGLSYTYVIAGDRKVDGNPHEPLTPRARNTIQEGVDRIYDLFVSTVAANRGLSQKTVRETQAAVYEGENAVEAGLADQVGTIDDALTGLRAEVKRRAAMDLKAKMLVALSLPEDATDAQVLLGVDQFVSDKNALVQRIELSEKKVAELDHGLKAALSEKAALVVDHQIELAKVTAISGGLEPLPKDVEDAARALFAAQRADLAKQTLERHVENSKGKRTALRDPSAKVQKEQTEAGAKAQTIEDAKAEAAKLVATKKRPTRGVVAPSK